MKIDPGSPPFILQNIPQYALLQQQRWVIDKINVAAAHSHTPLYGARFEGTPHGKIPPAFLSHFHIGSA